jgi:hypothetical protein
MPRGFIDHQGKTWMEGDPGYLEARVEFLDHEHRTLLWTWLSFSTAWLLSMARVSSRIRAPSTTRTVGRPSSRSEPSRTRGHAALNSYKRRLGGGAPRLGHETTSRDPNPHESPGIRR